MSELVSMASQFKGLPMEDLIGGPLQAACRAQMMMARGTTDYINAIGFEPVLDDKGQPTGQVRARMVDFEFERPNQDANGNLVIEKVKSSVPALAIVPMPSLMIDEVDVTFDMEVKSSFSQTESSDTKGSFDTSIKYGWGPFGVSIKIHGETATHKEQTRKSDNSARYHVEVHASQAGTPEGLLRILDMMVSAAAPRKIERQQVDANGEPTGQVVINPDNAAVVAGDSK